MNVRDNEVKKPAQDHQESSTKLPLELPTTQAPDNQIEADTAHPDTSRRWSMPNRVQLHLRVKKVRDWAPVVNVGIAFLALVVVALQAFIYNEQRKILNAQSEFMKTQTLAQTQIMEKSFNLSEKSLRMSERAYVGIVDLDANLAEGQVSIALNNFGKVPATAIKLEATVYRATPASGDTSDQSELKNIVTSKDLWDAGAVPLFPGNFRMPVVIRMQNFSQEEMRAVLAKKEIIYVAGSIQYEDHNGNADSSPFAYEYSPPPKESWTVHSGLSKLFNKNQP